MLLLLLFIAMFFHLNHRGTEHMLVMRGKRSQSGPRVELWGGARPKHTTRWPTESVRNWPVMQSRGGGAHISLEDTTTCPSACKLRSSNTSRLLPLSLLMWTLSNWCLPTLFLFIFLFFFSWVCPRWNSWLPAVNSYSYYFFFQKREIRKGKYLSTMHCDSLPTLLN